MAEIQSAALPAKQHGARRKILSTRVDLTPMVDLGFLLITFFVFTTSISKPQAMNIVVPAEGAGTFTAEHKTLNLVLAENNRVYFYIGRDVGNRGCTDFSPRGVRAVIGSMQEQVRRRFGNKDETVILVRPMESSSYGNLVDILDEILIAGIKKYALMDTTGQETIASLNLERPC